MNGPQYEIEDELKAHRTDPPAAKAAAQFARESAASNKKRILAYLETQGATGGTFREIADALGLDPAESNRRCSDLFTDRLIIRLAATRRSAKGAAAHVYVRVLYARGQSTV